MPSPDTAYMKKMSKDRLTLTKNKFEELRKRLLDLTSRNRLISTPLSRKTASLIRVINTQIDPLFRALVKDKTLDFVPLPHAEGDPADEQTVEFSYDLPAPDEHPVDNQNIDNKIHTSLPAQDLEQRASRIHAKGRSFLDETGVNILQGAFGFLKWKESENSDKYLYSPLILLPVRMLKKSSGHGLQFSVTSVGENATLNRFLFEKLKGDFGLELPDFKEGDSIEGYLRSLSDIDLSNIDGRIKRFVCFGDFKAAQIVLYEDLDPEDLIVTDVVDKLMNGSGDNAASDDIAKEYETDEPEIEKKVPRLVLDSDASQFSALVDIGGREKLSY